MRDVTTRPAGARKGRMAREVAEGLSRPQKELSPKYFYDSLGSLLFDEITRLPEYYLTATERELLLSFGQRWLASVAPASVVELGAGTGEKTRILLDVLASGAWYVPVDISASYLEAIAADIGADYPHLEIVPARADISADLALPDDLPRPAVYAFLGSTIGNFDMTSAVRLLQRVRHHMTEDDRLLLGADLHKDARILHAAYNDSRGVTAAFNKNILRALNRELGANFEPDEYEHLAFYDAERRRIEMHLVARSAQRVDIPHAGTFTLEEGETIRTEISCKYDRAPIERLFERARLAVECWVTDPAHYYALVTGRVAT